MLNLKTAYTAALNGPGPAAAREVAKVAHALAAGRITEDEAVVLVEEAFKAKPFAPSTDPDEVRRIVADPDFQQWMRWQNANPPQRRGRAARTLVKGSPEDVDRIWRD